MNNEMKAGAILALQGVKEEISTILSELDRKGFDEPRGFSVLQQYVNDRISEFKESEGEE